MQFFVYLVTLTLLHLSSLPVCTPLYEHLSIPYRKHFRNFIVTSIFEVALLLKLSEKLDKG